MGAMLLISAINRSISPWFCGHFLYFKGGELGIFSICHGCHVVGQCPKQKYFPLVLWSFSIFQGGGGLSICSICHGSHVVSMCPRQKYFPRY